MVFGDRSQRDAPPEPPVPAAIAPEVTDDPSAQGRGGELFVWFGTTFDLLALFFILGTVLRFLDVWSASFFAALCALTALILSCLVRTCGAPGPMQILLTFNSYCRFEDLNLQ